MFLGLDLSLRETGFTIINNDYEVVVAKTLSVPQKGTERLFFLESLLTGSIPYEGINLVCIESPAYGIEAGQLHSLGKWAGIVELHLWKTGLKFLYAAPSQVKKYASGSGKNVTKDLVLLDVYKNFGEEFRNNNIADAYVLSRIARDYYYVHILNQETALKKYQSDVLSRINKTENQTNDGTIL